MTTRKLFPIGREIRFISFVTLVILLASLVGVAILMVVFNRELDEKTFADAFYTLRTLYLKMNLYSVLAVVFQFAISAAIVYVVALRYSHKISGPMYRIRMILNDFQEGKAVRSVTFREGDFLRPLEVLMRRNLDRLSEQEQCVADLKRLLQAVPVDGVPDEATKKQLQAIADRLEVGHA